MKVIIISGTPGTDKTALAKHLVDKLGYARLDLHDHYKTISYGYNKKKKCYDVDLKKFEKLVKAKIKVLKGKAFGTSRIIWM